MWERFQEALDWELLPCRSELGSEDPSASKQPLQQGQNSLACHPLLPSKWGPVWNKGMSLLNRVSPNRARVVLSGKGCGYPAGQK